MVNICKKRAVKLKIALYIEHGIQQTFCFWNLLFVIQNELYGNWSSSFMITNVQIILNYIVIWTDEQIILFCKVIWWQQTQNFGNIDEHFTDK